MYTSEIVLPSAGVLCIAAVALLFFVFQGWFWIRRPGFEHNGWGAALSFATALFATAAFVQFNTQAGRINHLCELLQHSSLVLMVHSIYGYTFAYFGLPSRRYHQVAACFHGLLLALIWFTELIYTSEFVQRDFYFLDRPYIEPKTGPLAPIYMGYALVAAWYSLRFWFKYGRQKGKSGKAFIIGLIIWGVFCVHDGLVMLGLPTVQFLLAYGFLGFSASLMYATLKTYIELYEIAEQRQERLAEEKDRLDVTIGSIADGFIATDIEGRIVMINRAAQELTGWPRDRAIGAHVEKVVRNRIEDEAGDRGGAQGGLMDGEVLVALDGTERRVSETRSPIHDQSGNVVGSVLVLKDTTDRWRLQEKLIQSQKMEAIGVLAGGVAHDLNNVLAGLISYPDLLLMQLPDDSPMKRPILTMKSSGERAAAMVQDLLTLARRGVSTSQVVSLNQIITDLQRSPEVLNILQYHPRVRLQTSLDPDLKNTLGSPVHLAKAILNLVSNAAEALPQGGTVIIATENRQAGEPVRGYEIVEPGSYAVVKVSDNGTGISPEDLTKIFEPFYTKKVMGRSGTGLGMPVVWGTVKDCSGFIDVDSRVGQGTTFTLFFPATRRTVMRQSADPSIDTFMGQGETILVVDDVQDQREIATRILERLGYRVTTVASGEEAVSHLQDHAVDLLLLDMIMDPGMDGLQTYTRILEQRPGQRVVLTSGFAETDSIRQAQKLGAGAYLKKPYSLRSLGRAVRAELDRSGPGS